MFIIFSGRARCFAICLIILYASFVDQTLLFSTKFTLPLFREMDKSSLSRENFSAIYVFFKAVLSLFSKRIL